MENKIECEHCKKTFDSEESLRSHNSAKHETIKKETVAMKKSQKNNKLIERAGSITSSFSGGLSFLGGYQVCHNICLGIIALLSIIGITLVGMPLLFLTKVAIPFWIAAFSLFVISLFFYFRNKCISKNLLLFNGGIIIAAVPFNSLKGFLVFFWIIGGTIVLISIVLFIKERIIRPVKKNTKNIKVVASK